MSPPLLKWTGHPLADVGVATLCAMAGKKDPEALTLEDLDAAGQEISKAYSDPIFVSYLSCVYMNAAYIQPNMKPDEYKKKVKRMSLPHRVDPDEAAAGLRCVFSGMPAHLVLTRTEMPMLTGTDYFNFYPAGQTGLPVSAPFGVAIHALAMGGRRSEGKLLIVHCDDPQWTLQFARRYLTRNRQLIDLARAGSLPDKDGPSELLERECAGWDNAKKRPKYPDAKAPESLVMADLTEVATERDSGRMAEASTSVTVYLLSNSGQGPSLAIEHIPGNFVQFLQKLHQAEYSSRWQRLVHRSWQAPKGETLESAEGGDEGAKPKGKGKAKAKGPSIPPGPGRSRNSLYNDLLPIFESGYTDWSAASRFVRRHLLSDPTRFYMDPNGYAARAPKFGQEQLELIDWKLTTLFLMEVLGMNQERVDRIRKFADGLAEIIDTHNDKGLFRGLVFTSAEYQYRLLLTKAQRSYAQDRNSLLFGFEDYLDMFLADDAGERVHWSLIRDLISIRLVESLFHKQFFDKEGNKALLDQPEETDAAA